MMLKKLKRNLIEYSKFFFHNPEENRIFMRGARVTLKMLVNECKKDPLEVLAILEEFEEEEKKERQLNRRIKKY